jgi:hypothetical protein
MKTSQLNSDVQDLFRRRETLIAELNAVEAELQEKKRKLINGRTVETMEHDVFRCAERRCACEQ